MKFDFLEPLRRRNATAAILLARKEELAPLAEAWGVKATPEAVAAAYQAALAVGDSGDPVLKAIQVCRGPIRDASADGLTLAVHLLHPGATVVTPLTPEEFFRKYPALDQDIFIRSGVYLAHLIIKVNMRMSKANIDQLIVDNPPPVEPESQRSFDPIGYIGRKLGGLFTSSKHSDATTSVAEGHSQAASDIPTSEAVQQELIEPQQLDQSLDQQETMAQRSFDPIGYIRRQFGLANSSPVSEEHPAASIEPLQVDTIEQPNTDHALDEETETYVRRVWNGLSDWMSRRYDDVDYLWKSATNLGFDLSRIDLDALLAKFMVDDLAEAGLEETDNFKKFNILVAGSTGSGKSTLINAIFGDELAESGMGKPVTPETKAYEIEGIPFRLWDTAGLEMKAYQQTLSAISKQLDDTRQSAKASEHLHLLWLCITESVLKVEDGHIALSDLVAKHGIPAIVVLTRAGSHPTFKDVVRTLIPTATNVVRVRAKDMSFDGMDFKAFGLEELINATRASLPDGVKAAFDAAQQKQFQTKFSNAERLPIKFAGMAGAASAVPIPVASAASIIPIQIKMIFALNATLGIPLSREHCKPLIIAVLSALSLSAVGRMLVISLLDAVPGLNFAAEAINATMATTVTLGLGHAYIEFIKNFYQINKRMPSYEDIAEGFKNYWQQQDARNAEAQAACEAAESC